jgi:hypothetical protein
MLYHTFFSFSCDSQILMLSMSTDNPPRNPRESMGRMSIFIILGAQQEEHLIYPLRAHHATQKELNLGGEGNNHSSQPPKLHLMDMLYDTF